ncbi:hypothetical protein PHYSODRAFT_523118, partial [Phytophthora sojae]
QRHTKTRPSKPHTNQRKRPRASSPDRQLMPPTSLSFTRYLPPNLGTRTRGTTNCHCAQAPRRHATKPGPITHRQARQRVVDTPLLLPGAAPPGLPTHRLNRGGTRSRRRCAACQARGAKAGSVQAAWRGSRTGGSC